ncbi:hypothetical protein OAB57_00080 [Bacteriovoracaceae bacterium]|nr:hypothetical protein [Bacteriovoracaceae bacterium]
MRYSILLLLKTFTLAYGIDDIDSLVMAAKGNRIIQSKDPVASLTKMLSNSFLGNYTLVKKSNSLQYADTNNPRVVLASSDYSTVLTFNGNIGIGKNSIEAITFGKKTIDFHRIKFIKNIGSSFFSMKYQKNPKVCSNCHKVDEQNLRPIWPKYPRWKNFFGEQNDRVDMPPLEQIDPIHMERYESLIGSHNEYKYFPYHSNDSQNLGLSPNFRFATEMLRKVVAIQINRKYEKDRIANIAALDYLKSLYINCADSELELYAESVVRNAKIGRAFALKNDLNLLFARDRNADVWYQSGGPTWAYIADALFENLFEVYPLLKSITHLEDYLYYSLYQIPLDLKALFPNSKLGKVRRINSDMKSRKIFCKL